MFFYRSEYPKVLEFADKNRTEDQFVDIVVVADEISVPANKLVLACCSEVFERMFKSKFREGHDRIINITAVDGVTVKKLIDFMYTGKIFITNENVFALLDGANYLQMDEVKNFCSRFLQSILTDENCYSFLEEAERFGLELLEKRIYNFIASIFNEYSKTEDFKKLSEHNISSCISVLNKKNLCNASLYKAVIAWTNHDMAAREKHCFALLQLVDFNRLPKKLLEDVVFKETLVKSNLNVLTAVFRSWDLLSKKDSESTILSFGGLDSSTSKKAIEVLYSDKRQSYFRRLPISLNGGWAVELDECIYYGGGRSVSMHSNSNPIPNKHVWRMKLDGEKSDKISFMNEPRFGSSATVMFNKLVVTGGKNKHKILSSVECYTPDTNDWRFIESTNLPKDSHALVAFGGFLYDIGGWDGENCLSSVEQLRGEKDTWKFVEPMKTKRGGLAAVSCNGCIYAIGGQSGIKNRTITDSVEKYNPESSSQWSFVQKMNYERSGHTACVLQGKIYVVGGENKLGNFVKPFECYDPEGDVWTVLNNCSTENFCNHSLVVAKSEKWLKSASNSKIVPMSHGLHVPFFSQSWPEHFRPINSSGRPTIRTLATSSNR